MVNKEPQRLTTDHIIRAGCVTRWQIVRTARQQTLAEHCYLVAMLTDRLAKTILDPLRYRSNRSMILDWAMHHDIIEVVTGDIATPAKQLMGRPRETDIFYEYDEIRQKVQGTPIVEIVKLADLWEAWQFLEIEGIGRHAEEVKSEILYKSIPELIELANKKWPDVKWHQAKELMGC